MLSTVFCIDIGAFAVMSNHYHVVLRVDVSGADKLSDDQVIARMSRLYRCNSGMKRHIGSLPLTETEQLACKKQIAHWRSLLTDISRFMAEVNQYIARRANIEEDCKGKFWEARFHSQAILDTASLLRTLVYVDLNPVRSKQVSSVLAAKHTSVVRRNTQVEHGLIPFSEATANTTRLLQASSNTCEPTACLPLNATEYRELLEWTARQIKSEIPMTSLGQQPKLVGALGYSQRQWLRTQVARPSWHQRAIGAADNIVRYCRALNRQWIWQSADHKIEM